MRVKIVEHTPNPEKVVASASKLCYSPVGINEIMSNLTDENTTKFIDRLISYGHESPLEHISFTFAVEGVSRSLTHQLVRHRIASYSQQSQRYVKLDQFEYITPPAVKNNPKALTLFNKLMDDDQRAYVRIVQALIDEMIMKHSDGDSIVDYKFIKRWKESNKQEYAKIEKQAIENARYVFPNACETKIMFTMNARSLFNFFNHRCCVRAQWEIRQMATEMLRQVKEICPTIFKTGGARCKSLKYCPEGKMGCGAYPNLENIIGRE